MRYVYSIVRYVPNPWTGECINMGAVAGSDEAGDWALRHVQNDTRARAIGSAAGVAAVYDFFARAHDHVQRLNAGEADEAYGEGWLRSLYEEHRNIIQFTPVAPIGATSAEDALDNIFDDLVIDPVRQRRGEFQPRSIAISALRNAFRQRGASDRFVRPRARLSTGRVSTPLDFVVMNGAPLAVAHAWSFAVQGQDELARDVKAWGWSINEMRLGGGVVYVGDEQLHINRDVPVDVVYIPPRFEHHEPAFHEAQQVFDELQISYRPIQDVAAVAARAAALLVEHGVDLPRQSTSAPQG